jgi:hypothetical protein
VLFIFCVSKRRISSEIFIEYVANGEILGINDGGLRLMQESIELITQIPGDDVGVKFCTDRFLLLESKS